MALTPAALLVLLQATVDRGQEWTEALIFEKLGFNWDTIAYGSSGTKSIVFAQPYASGITDIDIRIKVFDANGDDIGGTINEATKSNTGFDVYVDDVCTLFYVAFQAKVTVPL